MKNTELKTIAITTTIENHQKWMLAVKSDGFRAFTPWAIHVLNKYTNDKVVAPEKTTSNTIQVYQEPQAPQNEVIAKGSGYTITKMGDLPAKTGDSPANLRSIPRGFAGGCHLS